MRRVARGSQTSYRNAVGSSISRVVRDIDSRQPVYQVRPLSEWVDEALAQLRRAFPVRVPGPGDFTLDEPSDYPDGGEEGYAAIERDYIGPIEQAHALSLRITTAIANEFGAHG